MHSIHLNNQAINQRNQDNIKHESIHKESFHIYRIKKDRVYGMYLDSMHNLQCTCMWLERVISQVITNNYDNKP